MKNSYGTYIAKTLSDTVCAEQQMKKISDAVFKICGLSGVSFCGEEFYLDFELDRNSTYLPLAVTSKHFAKIKAMIEEDEELAKFLSNCSGVTVAPFGLPYEPDCEMSQFKNHISGKVRPTKHSFCAGDGYDLLIAGDNLGHPARMLWALWGCAILCWLKELDAVGFHDGSIYLKVADGHEFEVVAENAWKFFGNREYATKRLDVWIVVSRHPITNPDPQAFEFTGSFPQ